jgi:hypothetical protein
MRQMIQASAKVGELEDQIYPDGDGSEIAEELRKKECRLKKLREAREVLEREKKARRDIRKATSAMTR